MINKHNLTEREICSQYIRPAIVAAGWLDTQIREEVTFTAGRIRVKGRLTARGESKRADFLLYHANQPNLPLAVVEAKDNNHSVGAGMQQALRYAEMLDVPFVFSSNGDAFLAHDRTRTSSAIELELPLDRFPSPDELWARYAAWKHLTPQVVEAVEQPYHTERAGRAPRYYQQIAINRTVEAIAKGQRRILLVMATGTGKTYTAFQIMWRLWKSRSVRRILFLADRNILVNQAMTNDFREFGAVMTKVRTCLKR